jgi:hypothetical protein
MTPAKPIGRGVKRRTVAKMVAYLEAAGIPDLNTPGDYRLEAPPGMKWVSTGTHEVIAAEWRTPPGWRRRLLESLMDDALMGVEKCDDPACDWCDRSQLTTPEKP